MNIILCGLPMSGKSHYGKLLSQYLDWPFIDTDLLIEALYKRETNQTQSCREIFESKGELYFREIEQKAIDSLTDIKKSIISIGGGALLSSENVSFLKKIGKLVYLESDLETLIHRLQEKKSPPAYLDPKDPIFSFKELAQIRIPIYKKYCDTTVSIKGLSDIEVLARISSHLI